MCELEQAWLFTVLFTVEPRGWDAVWTWRHSSSQQAVEDNGRSLAGIQEHGESKFPPEDAAGGSPARLSTRRVCPFLSSFQLWAQQRLEPVVLWDRNCGPMLGFPDTELGTHPEWQVYTTAAQVQVCLFFLGNEFSAPVGNCARGRR